MIQFEPGPRRDIALVQRSGSFQRAVRTVNDEFDLPHDLRVRVIGDRAARRQSVREPLYVPERRTIYFPWSFIDRSRGQLNGTFRGVAPGTPKEVLRAAMTFALYHELAHGLIDLLDTPVVGGEEPTADSLATVFAIAGRTGGAVVPLAAATLLRGQPGPRVETSLDFTADHDLAPQRAYDALCLVYGSNPARYERLVGGDLLSPARASSCEFDYLRELRSWRRLLGRWLTDQGGLRPLPGQ